MRLLAGVLVFAALFGALVLILAALVALLGGKSP